MYSIANENSRVGWLLGRLANRRNSIVDLVRRLTGIGRPGALKPSVFAKFLRMLDDVAVASREEVAIIGQIDDIEQKHRLMRGSKKLRQAAPRMPRKIPYPANQDDPQPAERPGSIGLLKLVVFWYLFMQQKRNQKKQGLTAD